MSPLPPENNVQLSLAPLRHFLVTSEVILLLLSKSLKVIQFFPAALMYSSMLAKNFGNDFPPLTGIESEKLGTVTLISIKEDRRWMGVRERAHSHSEGASKLPKITTTASQLPENKWPFSPALQ